MSGQWELVTKKKDKGSKLPVLKANHTKDLKNTKNIFNGVKVEEVLPKSQVQNLYSKSKENKIPDKTKSKENLKKPQKKEKPVEQPKPKPPKSIESALNAIDVDEFKYIYEKVKTSFPDTPIVWLKELAQYLNQKVSVDNNDSVFGSKPIDYPLNVVPPALMSLIEKVVNESGRNNNQLFFDICLTAMVTDMSKGLVAVGHKIFLQYIALQEPKLITANIQKHIVLRNSYQNRPNIGLSILWALSHVGYKDFHSGLLVFRELFLPILEMKNYTRYVLTYLTTLINNNANKDLSLEELFLILDITYSNKKNMPVDLIKGLSNRVSEIKPMLFRNSSNDYHSYINTILKNITLNTNSAYQNCLCDILVEIFHKDQTTLLTWNNLYSTNVLSSAILLEYINNNWPKAIKRINKGALTNLLNSLKSMNVDLATKKRKEEGLKLSILSIQKIQEKMVAKNKGGFPYKSIFVLILALGGVILYDVKQHGSWNDSVTRKALKDYKVCEYTHVVTDKIKSGLIWSSEKIEEQFPGLQQKVVVFSEPYVELSINVAKIVRNNLYSLKDCIVEKYPIVTQSVEKYIPGLIENSQKALINVYSTTVLYFHRSVDYLKNEVFVGSLSPENMQKVVIEALNTTQHKATEYYHWIYNKVQTSIK